jgi:hypothetical protein
MRWFGKDFQRPHHIEHSRAFHCGTAGDRVVPGSVSFGGSTCSFSDVERYGKRSATKLVS